MKYLSIFALSALVLFSCQSNKTEEANEEEDAFYSEEGVESVYTEYSNPPAEGFDLEGSDVVATVIADKVMESMGGREAWDNTRYISWNFFGFRTLLWDKATGNVRIEVPSNEMVILVNINDESGRVQKAGVEMTDSLDYYLGMGKRIWINDSYWLVMPYKLKDSGVTLSYLREDTTNAGVRSDVLQMTFKDVGATPQNKYEVWVDSNDRLVRQWAYFQNATDSIPRWVLPWDNYEKKGEILLSSERGDRDLSEVEVYTDVPESAFTAFDSPVL